MAEGGNQRTEGENIAEGCASVDAMKNEQERRRDCKEECQAGGGDVPPEQVSRISTASSLASNSSTLVPRPPAVGRSQGGRNFRKQFQSAPLPECISEIPTHQDLPDVCAPRTRFRKQFRSEPLPGCIMETPTHQDAGAPRTDSALPFRPPGRAPAKLRARIFGAQVQQHRSETLQHFEPIDDISMDDESVEELSDSDAEDVD